jgi:protein-disulfide isomerase
MDGSMLSQQNSTSAKRLAVVLAVGVFGAVAPAERAGAQQETTLVRTVKRAAESRMKGEPKAPVLVYEIADFQCPYCARFAVEVFPQIDSAYVRTGKVRWVFVNLPLPMHANAWLAAESALCAGAEADRFWALHDRLFAAPHEWSMLPDPAPVLARYAKEEGVPTEAYQACVAGDRVSALILQDVLFGSGVSGTPTFVINNQQTIVGMKSFAEWQEVLETALKKK